MLPVTMLKSTSSLAKRHGVRNPAALKTEELSGNWRTAEHRFDPLFFFD
jgi:hypothetical protein